MTQAEMILAVNAGSSSLKFALYPHGSGEIGAARFSGQAEGLEPGGTPRLSVKGISAAVDASLPTGGGSGIDRALAALASLLDTHAADIRVVAVAHRIVHGGERFAASVVLDDVALDYLESLNPLAPLHQPHNLAGVRAFRRRFPQLPQIGCFDTSFHASLPEVEWRFALPQSLVDAGIRRYGFHGLSYRYVLGQLQQRSTRADGRVLIAHLGNGASVCAIKGGKSVATSMGFSALDGLMMGTRSGTLDPGVLLYLLQQGWSAERIERLLYRESGLLGVSGISADMRVLQASDDPHARMAIDLFIRRLVRECGALAACLGGIDAIAFTGGIGEHDTQVRARAVQSLAHLGLQMDDEANRAAVGIGMTAIHGSNSSCEIWVVPTDEGRVAAQDAARLIAG